VSNRHEPLTPGLVEPLLRGRLGRPYLWLETCTSTQDMLRDRGLPEGTVAVAEHQTAGRGRSGRDWHDEPGETLLASVLLRPPARAPIAQLSLVCGLAVVETVGAVSAVGAGIKWPNDVLVDGRKVAGILLEASSGVVVCGIGLNVNQTEDGLPREVRTPAASLCTITGREHDRAELLVTLLVQLEAGYELWCREGLAPFLPELERRDALRGSQVAVGDASGVADGIAPDGRLRLRSPDGGAVLVASGEVTREEGRG
jgi:BirA family transcriptional regulator, biotin operon repressor / biotin---[acetyl-CoA-carboxylase] ligase